MIDLRNADAIQELKTLPDESVDLVVTDPPYRTISGGTHSKWKSGYPVSILSKNDGKIFDNNDVNHLEWLQECYRVLKPNTHIYIMTNVLNLFELQSIAEKVGFKLHNLLVWEKNTCNANRWYMKNCEYTLFMRKGEAKTINNPSSKTVHQFNNPVGNKNHPTEKPIDLMKFYIENSSNKNDIVLDPFMGSGSTGVACKELNRNFIGIELDEKYFNIARERIENTNTQIIKKKTLI